MFSFNSILGKHISHNITFNVQFYLYLVGAAAASSSSDDDDCECGVGLLHPNLILGLIIWLLILTLLVSILYKVLPALIIFSIKHFRQSI